MLRQAGGGVCQSSNKLGFLQTSTVLPVTRFCSRPTSSCGGASCGSTESGSFWKWTCAGHLLVGKRIQYGRELDRDTCGAEI